MRYERDPALVVFDAAIKRLKGELFAVESWNLQTNPMTGEWLLTFQYRSATKKPVTVMAMANFCPFARGYLRRVFEEALLMDPENRFEEEWKALLKSNYFRNN